MVTRPEMPDDETLLAYVRGDLDAGEAERITKLASEQPELAADLALIRGLRAAAAEDDREARPPGALGWARLSREIEAERARQGSARPRLRPLWQLAAAAVCAIGLWQVAVVPFLTGRQDGSPGYAPVSEAPAAGHSLRVAFAPEATEGEIRALLQAIGAEVTGGPGALGLWTLSFRDADARAAALAELRASDLVESAQE